MMNHPIRSLTNFRYYFIFLGKYLCMLLWRNDSTIFTLKTEPITRALLGEILEMKAHSFLNHIFIFAY